MLTFLTGVIIMVQHPFRSGASPDQNIHNHIMSNEQNTGKRRRYDVTLRDDEKDFVESAANASGMTRSAYMRHASIKESEVRLGYQLSEHLNGRKAA